jgi:hypothetical protein
MKIIENKCQVEQKRNKPQPVKNEKKGLSISMGKENYKSLLQQYKTEQNQMNRIIK